MTYGTRRKSKKTTKPYRKTMKKISYLFLALMLLSMQACRQNKSAKVIVAGDSVAATEVKDSTIYGVCGTGTAMHTLELITDAGDTLSLGIHDETDMMTSPVKGGLMSGDRMAVVTRMGEGGELEAVEVINLTSLLGRWTSIDKNFEIMEGGELKSYVKAEADPWTSWKIVNGKLVFNKDTFSIYQLGADSLYLENGEGIFTYKRVK